MPQSSSSTSQPNSSETSNLLCPCCGRDAKTDIFHVNTNKAFTINPNQPTLSNIIDNIQRDNKMNGLIIVYRPGTDLRTIFHEIRIKCGYGTMLDMGNVHSLHDVDPQIAMMPPKLQSPVIVTNSEFNIDLQLQQQHRQKTCAQKSDKNQQFSFWSKNIDFQKFEFVVRKFCRFNHNKLFVFFLCSTEKIPENIALENLTNENRIYQQLYYVPNIDADNASIYLISGQKNILISRQERQEIAEKCGGVDLVLSLTRLALEICDNDLVIQQLNQSVFQIQKKQQILCIQNLVLKLLQLIGEWNYKFLIVILAASIFNDSFTIFQLFEILNMSSSVNFVYTMSIQQISQIIEQFSNLDIFSQINQQNGIFRVNLIIRNCARQIGYLQFWGKYYRDLRFNFLNFYIDALQNSRISNIFELQSAATEFVEFFWVGIHHQKFEGKDREFLELIEIGLQGGELIENLVRFQGSRNLKNSKQWIEILNLCMEKSWEDWDVQKLEYIDACKLFFGSRSIDDGILLESMRPQNLKLFLWLLILGFFGGLISFFYDQYVLGVILFVLMILPFFQKGGQSFLCQTFPLLLLHVNVAESASELERRVKNNQLYNFLSVIVIFGLGIVSIKFLKTKKYYFL